MRVRIKVGTVGFFISDGKTKAGEVDLFGLEVVLARSEPGVVIFSHLLQEIAAEKVTKKLQNIFLERARKPTRQVGACLLFPPRRFLGLCRAPSVESSWQSDHTSGFHLE